ncbi:MAG: transposase family protein, partial [Ignavibacteriae bacterium]|nr:transposase family protein [Ignavibacteriota bacterium]
RKINLSEAELTEDLLLEFFVDATEQQIQRPKKSQKHYYSGKKKKHTLKNQIVVDRKGKYIQLQNLLMVKNMIKSYLMKLNFTLPNE